MNELYIRMCQEAHEIQESWEPKPGDRILREWPAEPTILVRDMKYDDHYWVYTNTKYGGSGVITMNDMIKNSTLWLPRQEDLQELFRHKNGNPDEYWILKSFLVWFSHLTPTACPDREVSITQLWLQYVMETVYGKVWNGESWEEILL